MEQRSNRAGRAVAPRDYSFRNLTLWKKGQDLALDVIRLTDQLPRVRSADVIARQVVRSASSVPANIAEDHGRYSMAAYRNHLSMARGSVAETITWLDLLARAGHIPSEAEANLSSGCDELMAGLTSQMRALSTKIAAEGGPRVGEKRAGYPSHRDYEDDDLEFEVL